MLADLMLMCYPFPPLFCYSIAVSAAGASAVVLLRAMRCVNITFGVFSSLDVVLCQLLFICLSSDENSGFIYFFTEMRRHLVNLRQSYTKFHSF